MIITSTLGVMAGYRALKSLYERRIYNLKDLGIASPEEIKLYMKAQKKEIDPIKSSQLEKRMLD